MRVVKAFAREDFEIDKFERENQVYLERNIAATRLQALVYPLMLFITSIGTIAIIWFGGRQVVAGALTLGTLLAFNSLPGPPGPADAHAGLHHRLDLPGHRLRRAPVRDPRRQVARQSPAPGRPALRVTEGRVIFDHVSFGYSQPVRRATERAPAGAAGRHGRSRPSQPGRRLGRCRTSPSWRSRTRWSPCSGTPAPARPAWCPHPPLLRRHLRAPCCIDGQDVREVELQSLRRQIGIVMQESLLFSASVAENIAYGDPGASMERIVRRRARRRRSSSSPSCRRASRPRSASAG